MRSSRCEGSRNEMLCVEGFRLGSFTRCALDQSTRDVLSCFSQKARSSASDLKRAGALGFLTIDVPFLALHVARGFDAKQRVFTTQCEGNVKQSSFNGFTECMKAWLGR